MPSVSVIVPVYKAEKTLSKCITSILQQSFSDFELILVDDGSPDQSVKICNDFKNRDSRIKVLQKDNGGVSTARNKGIEHSRGKYICFVDSDDYVEPNTLEAAVNYMMASSNDLVIFGMCLDYYNQEEFIESKLESTNLNLKIDKVTINDWKILFTKVNMASPCNKLYKSEIIKNNQISFCADCVMYEDLKFNAEYCRYVEKIESVDTPLYHYRLMQGQDQLLKRSFKEPFENSDLVACSLIPYARELSEVRNNIFYSIAFQIYEYEIKSMVLNQPYKKIKTYLKMLIKNNSMYDELMNAQSYRKKVKLLKFLNRIKAYPIIVWIYKR